MNSIPDAAILPVGDFFVFRRVYSVESRLARVYTMSHSAPPERVFYAFY